MVVNVDVGGIEVLVFVIVAVTVIVAVGVSVEVEVDVAVGASVGTVWKSIPPQTTFCGIRRNNNKTAMSENSFKVHCLFISSFPVKSYSWLWNDHSRVAKVYISVKNVYNGGIFWKTLPLLREYKISDSVKIF